MILNIIVLVFVLAMAIFWSTQGLFSAFIHLLVTVVAGSLAFALWEPVTMGLLIDAVPVWSWTAGLLLPFAVVLVVLRILSNKVIGGNLKINGLADQAFGGVVGAVAGVVTAGVCLIGYAYLPLGGSILGYQPLEVQSNGQLGPPSNPDATAALWVPADRAAAGLFSFVSTRGFESSKPLALLRPNLADAAARFRLGQFYDPNGSLVANPSTVRVEAVRVFDGELPAEVPPEINGWLTGNAATRAGDRLVLVTTRWEAVKDTATYDEGILRLPPAQTLLLAEAGGAPVEAHLPVGWSKTPVTSPTAEFYGVVNNRSYASSELPEDTITFAYAIPETQTPRFFQTRNLRISLGQPEEDPDGAAVAALLGEPAIEAESEDGVAVATPNNAAAAAGVGEPVGEAAFRALTVEASNKLPGRISINAASGLNVEEKEVISGEQRVQKGDRTASVDSIRTPPGQVMVRMELAPFSTSQALPSAIVARVSGGDGRFKLVDARGNDFFARATVWAEESGEQLITVSDRIDNAETVPMNRLQAGDRYYAYWSLPEGLVLDKFVVGNMEQAVEFTVGQ